MLCHGTLKLSMPVCGGAFYENRSVLPKVVMSTYIYCKYALILHVTYFAASVKYTLKFKIGLQSDLMCNVPLRVKVRILMSVR